jgi:hypothetical protein
MLDMCQECVPEENYPLDMVYLGFTNEYWVLEMIDLYYSLGEREKAERLATDEGAWLNMLAEGATTTFEAWGKAQKWNTSLFHPWATAPLIVFAKSIEVY